MQNPYNIYQQQKQQGTGTKPKAKQKARINQVPVVRSKALPKKPKGSHQAKLILASFIGLVLSFYIFAYTDQFLDILARLEVGFGQVEAADGEEPAPESEMEEAKAADSKDRPISGLSPDASSLTMKNASVYKALKDKEVELEKKERRLARLEEDLQRQKEEIEKQLKEMTEMRRNISSKLDEKVVADQESVNKLVGVYSSMKPKNAAVIFSQLDEALAVKVLSQMKRQNAAAILDFVEPAKAQRLSEKYAGLKK